VVVGEEDGAKRGTVLSGENLEVSSRTKVLTWEMFGWKGWKRKRAMLATEAERGVK